jgi:hypothetical protein
MTALLAIDPGTTHSGWVMYANGVPLRGGVDENHELLLIIACHSGPVAIEEIRSYGMAIGQETIDTIRWIGRFQQVAGGDRVRLIPRKNVCQHICNTASAKDPNIRAALIDRYGGKAEAVGTIKKQGPLYWVKTHMWPALAVAVTATETRG